MYQMKSTFYLMFLDITRKCRGKWQRISYFILFDEKHMDFKYTIKWVVLLYIVRYVYTYNVYVVPVGSNVVSSDLTIYILIFRTLYRPNFELSVVVQFAKLSSVDKNNKM